MANHIAVGIGSTMALLVGCTAGDGCGNRVDAIMARSEQGSYSEALKNDLIQLRDAALVFAERGREQECANVANEMDDILDDYTRMLQVKRERAARKQYLEAAKPVAEIGGILKAEDIVGATVYNLHDEELGVIENVALDPNTGDIAYVALTAGGFIGLGEKLVAIPWRDLSRTADGEVYVLEIRRTALEQMKGFDAEQWPAQAGDRLGAEEPEQAPRRDVPPTQGPN